MLLTRRRAIRTAGSTATLGLAGCLGSSPPDARSTGTDGVSDRPSEPDETTPEDGTGPPTAAQSRHLAHDLETVRDNVISGGVSKDGIPAIDDPQFADGAEATLDDGDPVFGLVRNGVAKAYPQSILVWHEIVNDVIGGEPVAVTYCPLTGTAQGFERGDVEFGVSGRLLNSNLVMFDRATDSWWPQILATAITEPMEGKTLREFGVVWTTWEAWRETHPETQILTDDTGHVRRYGSDPYGGYNPPSGYYSSGDTLFPPLAEDVRAPPKNVVIGTRTARGALAFNKTTLLDARVLTGTIGDEEYVAIADDTLNTGYVYANPDHDTVTAEPDGYRLDGEIHTPTDLPLERTVAFDAMWFAWAGFYPDTTYVN